MPIKSSCLKCYKPMQFLRQRKTSKNNGAVMRCDDCNIEITFYISKDHDFEDYLKNFDPPIVRGLESFV